MSAAVNFWASIRDIPGSNLGRFIALSLLRDFVFHTLSRLW